jgi:hypothetical protein
MLYIALALVVVLIAAGIWWMRSRGESTPAPRTEASQPSNPPSITVVDAPATPRPSAKPAQDDSDATMIYRRPGEAPTPVAPPRIADGPSMAANGVSLVALNGNNKGKRFPVATAGITIGRNSACDIVLTDSCVSSRHAWIGPVDGKITLRDLKSTNGTFLNAQLRTSISEAQLRPGDTIFIGGHLGEQFRFEAD